MRDYWLVQYLLAAVGWTYFIGVLIATALALKLPKSRQAKVWATVIVIGLSAILPLQGYQGYRKEQREVQAYKARLEKAQALFAERCKTAGERIYKTVDNVEGVLLINPRPDRSQADRADRNWLGAGFPGESGGNQYIMEFLYFNKPQSGNYGRELGWVREGLRGYPYLDIEEEGSRFRYTLRNESEYVYGSDPVKAYGKREAAVGPLPQYVISYQNIEDPEGRTNWIAGGRVAVVDRKNGELLGEFVRYAFEPGFGNTGGERSPWGFATQCPQTNYGGSSGHIRSFVEQVIKPKQGK